MQVKLSATEYFGNILAAAAGELQVLEEVGAVAEAVLVDNAMEGENTVSRRGRPVHLNRGKSLLVTERVVNVGEVEYLTTCLCSSKDGFDLASFFSQLRVEPSDTLMREEGVQRLSPPPM